MIENNENIDNYDEKICELHELSRFLIQINKNLDLLIKILTLT